MQKNTQKIRKKLQHLDSRIGAILTLTPEINNMLKSFYSNEYIYITNVEILSETSFKIKYNFPVEDLTQQINKKVSLTQIQLAILQGIYLSLCIYQKNNPDSILKDCLLENIRDKFHYFKDERVFTKNVLPSVENYLFFNINDIIDKDEFYLVKINIKPDIDCFMYGNIEGLIIK